MRISINIRPIDGPFGGGNQFAKVLARHFSEQGHECFFSLVDNLDIILIFSSRRISISSYSLEDISEYKKHNRVVVLNRTNGCDGQRASSLPVTADALAADEISDATIFVSQFMKNYYLDLPEFSKNKPFAVIPNGADTDIFNLSNKEWWDEYEPVKLVTHHWSTDPFKGFEFYQAIDKAQGSYIFTYVGRTPQNVQFKNHVLPLSGGALAAELKKHHVYITASRKESGPNHPIEAILCGLPILYVDSGAMREYCEGYGSVFTPQDWKRALSEVMSNYTSLTRAISSYPLTSEQSSRQYIQFAGEIHERLGKITT